MLRERCTLHSRRILHWPANSDEIFFPNKTTVKQKPTAVREFSFGGPRTILKADRSPSPPQPRVRVPNPTRNRNLVAPKTKPLLTSTISPPRRAKDVRDCCDTPSCETSIPHTLHLSSEDKGRIVTFQRKVPRLNLQLAKPGGNTVAVPTPALGPVIASTTDVSLRKIELSGEDGID